MRLFAEKYSFSETLVSGLWGAIAAAVARTSVPSLH